MSIKKLFDANKSHDILISTNLEEEVVKNAPELESADNVREQIERINRYIPQVDFDDPNNFVVYGSAKSYYEEAISRIYREFPYDGSEEEITKFHNESTYLDLHLFDNKYPRTTGYAILSADGWGTAGTAIGGWGSSSAHEYISIVGGPHTASGGMPTGKLHTAFTGSNYYDTDIYTSDGTLPLERVGSRGSNLQYNLANGVTTEFWLKKDAWITSSTGKEVLFDLWNGEASSSVGYGRFLLYLTGAVDGTNPLRLHIGSGSNTADINLLASTSTTASVGDAAWHHYAVTTLSGSTGVVTKAYIDGTLNNTATSTIAFGDVTGSLKAFIGALQTTPSGNTFHGQTMTGYGKLSGSLDEFRYWKAKRDEKDIQNNWWTQVRGGTNNEIANAELGVYYKFNEGVTGTSSVDSAVLDYSGRISNGTWVGYPGSNARSTSSAIDSSSAVVAGTVEYKDPIIYSSHPDVLSLYSDYSTTGSVYDNENQSSLIDSIPNWIVEQDELDGTQELKKLTQIIGSYFDTLHLQVKDLPALTDNSYLSSSHKSAPFARNLLSSRGLAVPDIFVDADLLERFANRGADRKYDLKLDEVKNLIYQNIYNNLSYIYKSKGTEKAFRNLIRCYGIGDEVIKFNAYGNNTTFKFDDTDYDTTIRKNFVDFNHPDRFTGIVYQSSSAASSETTGITYVTGTSEFLANTAEVEVIFPKKFDYSNPQHFPTSFLSSSIFGHHVADTDATDFSWQAQAADKNFQLYAVRTAADSKDVYFLLKDRAGNFELTSSVYSNVYDNQKWNFAVRVKNQFWPYSAGITGSTGANKVEIEWYGVNVEFGVVKNEFSLSSGAVTNAYLTSPRRYYIGADRTNSTGTVVTKSDMKISSLRHWASYLSDAVITEHAKDPSNIGTLNPSRNALFTADTTGIAVDNQSIPEMATLALHWDFSQVTGSDSSGAFTVEDASSGSVSLQSRYNNDANISYIIANQYAGVAYFPTATSTTTVIDKDFVPAAKQRLPESVSTSDAVSVLSRDDELFPRDAAVSQTFFAFEKSMYGTISQEMVDYFGTVTEFNNLIGDVVHKYRGEYKGLRLLRQLFFEKIQNNPDLDKFIDYYKWVDSSLAIFLQQLVPASANVSDEIRVLVEDHLLDRSKYQHKYPLLDYKGNERFGADEDKLEARIKSFEELAYDWEHGHAPLNNLQNTSALWWKERAKRSNTNFATAAAIDSARQSISDIILSFNSASAEKFNTGAGETGVYEGSAYAVRKFTSPLRLTPSLTRQVGGGSNYPLNNKPDSVFSITKRGDTTARYDVTSGAFKDIVIAEVGEPMLGIKRRKVSQLTTDNLDQKSYKTNKFASPAVLYSSSAGTEYSGLHSDTYGDDYEVPMQGPFPQEHVGGNRHRHIELTVDPALTSSANRPEAWYLASGIFRANDGTFAKPSTSPQYRRDETAKRPVNIKNIQHTTASVVLGNYNKTYEVVQTSNRATNKSAFVKAEGFSTASAASARPLGVTGLVEYTKPVRTRHAHVFVERFSAPGGPETAGDNQGGAGLDYESAQFSPYNSLNYRNTTVRQPLQTLLTERSEQFGLRSGSAVSSADYTSVTASYHKVNRNPLSRLETGSSGVITASSYDNYYVQHMIPRSDYQYTWVTASYVSSETNVYGYFPYDGHVSTSAGLVGAINFTSASNVGSAVASGLRLVPGHFGVHSGLVPTNFVGMNTTIIEPINSGSDYTLGYPLDMSPFHYYNYSDMGTYAIATTNQSSFVEKIGASAPAQGAAAATLNNIINHRNGPYGHSTWKQLRVGHGQLARYYRKNNIYTHTLDSGDPIVINEQGTTRTIAPKYGPTLQITQSPIDEAQKPMVYKVRTRGTPNSSGRRDVNTVVFKTSFANNLLFFNDSDFNEALELRVKKSDTPYGALLQTYKKRRDMELLSLSYREVVYPSRENIYASKTRERTGFENDFWKDSRTDRTTLAITKKPTNSAGVAVSQSAWVLDASENFVSLTGIAANDGGTGSANTAGHKAGELQNEYVHFHYATASSAVPGALYSRKHIYSLTGSITSKWGLEIKEIATASADSNLLNAKIIGKGEALWEAGTKAGRYEGTSSVFTVSPVNPFYNTYQDFSANIRGKGKSCSIVPEFRISQHLEFYRNNGDNFLTENSKIFEIPGTTEGSSVPQNSAEDSFYTIFTNSDFLKYFEFVKKDHEEVADPHKITLRCKAVKKFIPYDGFYPAERTVQMAKQFITDYSGSVTYLTGSDTTEDSSLRTFLAPMFSPGLLYNTIKSGIAVDYPTIKSNIAIKKPTYDNASIAADVTTGSYALFSAGTAESGLASSGIVNHNAGWDSRIPFEALAAPEEHLANIRIADSEPSPYAFVDSVVSWDGTGGTTYKKMMNNFLAESVNFFLKRGQLTTIESLPESEFKTVTPGTPYGMRVKIWRSMDKGKIFSGSYGNFEVPQNARVMLEAGEIDPYTGNLSVGATEVTPRETFTMYSRPSAFGPPLGLIRSGSAPSGTVAAADATVPGSIYDFSPQNGVYASHTPPYYDGECWFDIVFWPRGLETQRTDSTPHVFRFKRGETGEQYQPTLNEIFSEPHEAIFNQSASIDDDNQTPLAGSFKRKWRYDQETLKSRTGSTYHVTSSGMPGLSQVGTGPACGPWANKWAMQLDASLNIFRKSVYRGTMSGDSSDRKWSIQTKFETPMLNFNHVTSSDGTMTITSDVDSNFAIPRGMWHQFGRIPRKEEGVYIQVTDIPKQWLENHPSASLKHDLGGTFASENKSPYIAHSAQGGGTSSPYGRYSVPIGSGSNWSRPEVQSLVDICGFDTTPQRVGEMRKRKKVFEAIVAVPFWTEGGERRFFKTWDPNSATTQSVAGETYKKLHRMMKKYVFPPTFDFVNNPTQGSEGIEPVAMYVFEFSHTLDQDDLSHIWQNLPPRLGTTPQVSTSTISHKLLSNELMGDPSKAIESSIDKEKMQKAEMKDKVQWMVFKVKQRAKRDYFTEIDGRESVMPFYTYNWPYDYFSMVEMAQLEVGVELKGKKNPDGDFSE